MTSEELDFIINYDIKYRMGRGGEMHRLETIRADFAVSWFDFTEHAAEKAVERNISEPGIRAVGLEIVLVEGTK